MIFISEEIVNEEVKEIYDENETRYKEVVEELKVESSNDLTDNFYIFSKITKKSVRGNWDAVYGVSGLEGVGKTTFGYQFGKSADDKFEMSKNILFSPDKENIRKAIIGLHRYAVVDVDEAIKILYKLQWYTDMQVFLNIIYGLCRRENKISLLLMPRFKDFNEFFRNHRIKLWIHILDRGIAVVFTKHWSPFIDDPWLMKDNQNNIDRMMKRFGTLAVPTKEKVRILMKSPNFLMMVGFPPMTKEEEDEFERLRREAGVYDEEYSVTKWEKLWRERFYTLVNYIQKNKILTATQMADFIHWDDGSLRAFMCDMREKIARRVA